MFDTTSLYSRLSMTLLFMVTACSSGPASTMHMPYATGAPNGQALDDMWTTGGTTDAPLHGLLHYDGSNWTQIHLPAPFTEYDNASFGCYSPGGPDALWIVLPASVTTPHNSVIRLHVDGTVEDHTSELVGADPGQRLVCAGTGANRFALTQLETNAWVWNGTAFVVLPPPPTEIPTQWFIELVFTDHDLWASTFDSNTPGMTPLWHYDGATWTMVGVVPGYQSFGGPALVAADSNHFWGYLNDGKPQGDALIHYDGSSFQTIQIGDADAQGGDAHRDGLAARSADEVLTFYEVEHGSATDGSQDLLAQSVHGTSVGSALTVRKNVQDDLDGASSGNFGDCITAGPNTLTDGTLVFSCCAASDCYLFTVKPGDI